jgi:uncharacterized protein (UPF0332 family)
LTSHRLFCINIKGNPIKRRENVKEALRYLNNAKEILKDISVENGTYTDIKKVREAFGTAYLAVLESINEVLLKKGVTKRDLPKSVDAYRTALQKHVAVHDGKLLREFEMLYDVLHIAGYYRALIYNVNMVKDAIKAAKSFIDKLS